MPAVTVKTPSPARNLRRARALWVDPATFAWPTWALPAKVKAADLRWTLHHSASGALVVEGSKVTAADARSWSLQPDAAALTTTMLAEHPQLRGYTGLRLDPSAADLAAELLRGQVVVTAHDQRGRLRLATGVQVPWVLDALYPAATAAPLGVHHEGGRTTFSVWAPTAQSVALLTWPAGSDPTASEAQRHEMARDDASGVWSVGGEDLTDVRYLFEVTVFSREAAAVVTNQVTDPYSVALTLNSTHSVAVDLDEPRWRPQRWLETPSPALPQPVDSTIYELHVRDFSIADQTIPADHRGSYLAFADDGLGTRHLKNLVDAGLNTLHLLPTFDITSIEEDRTKQLHPQGDLAAMAPDSEDQQRAVSLVSASDGYNWGYDPYHFFAPEGSYASSNAAADGGTRIAEFRTMVGALHAMGLRVVLDQVFNHTTSSGQAPHSVLDKIVPGYYHRLNGEGFVETSTCCQNTATEHAMMQRILVDACVLWAKDYRVDGFRFDLMGHHSAATMRRLRAALNELTLETDGVDGPSIYLYGEGWNFGEVADNALFVQATQGQLDGTGIGCFNDRLRDAVRGGGPFAADPRQQGFGTGEGTDPNGFGVSDATASLLHDMDLVALSLAGNLKDFEFTTAGGKRVRGRDVLYKGGPAAFASEPAENVNYVDAHDNETLFDEFVVKLPERTSMADRIRMNTLALATVALGQSPAFWHAGTDLLRSKSLDRDSYNSGDWFNQVHWDGSDNGFGHGLPVADANQGHWPMMQPLLARRDLKPTAAESKQAAAMAADLLRLRFSTPLFRLGSAELIAQKVGFPVNGTPALRPGVLVMVIDDTAGQRVDSEFSRVVVVFNATPDAVTQPVPGLTGEFELSLVQADGADPVVRTAHHEAGCFSVPARTVAVFVQR